ncbi:hypothetical protein [Haloarcula argentinensis]|nr:hypothetical protein [Haloarcula argentinensis]
MDTDTDIYDVFRSDDSCKEKLQQLGYIADSGTIDLHFYTKIIEDCGEVEPKLAFERLEDLIRNRNILTRDLDFALRAAGNPDPKISQEYLNKWLEEKEYSTAYVTGYIPHIYWHHTDFLQQELRRWYSESPVVFERAVEKTLEAYYRLRRTDEDLNGRDSELLATLTDITENEEIDAETALNSVSEDNDLLRADNLLKDLQNLQSNLDSYGLGIDYDQIRSNADSYLFLTDILGEDWVDDLQAQGNHRLARFLSHDIAREDVYMYSRANQDIDIKTRNDLESIHFLSYLDHCCESLHDHHDPTESLGADLINRQQYEDTVTEIQTINALRREFLDHEVIIEESIAGRDPDLKVELDDNAIWVEVTHARRTKEARLNSVFSAPSGIESNVRAKVTEKTRGQIKDIKKGRPNDLTMVVLKNEFSAIDNHHVREYAEGGHHMILEEGADHPTLIPGKPVAMQDTEDFDDNNIEDLDLLVNFELSGGLKSPYIEGQVFCFNANITETLLKRLGEAFNAGNRVFTSDLSFDGE